MNKHLKFKLNIVIIIFHFIEHLFRGNRVIDMETLENVMPTFRVSSFDGKHSSFSASREYDTVNIFRRESVNSLSLRCRGLTVCQCQRDKKKKEEYGKRRRQTSLQISNVLFYFYSHRRQNAKLSRLGVR